MKKEYADKFSVEWLEPLGFNNTYALAMRQQQAQELGIKTISDLKPHTQELVFGADSEFLSRPDGLPGLQKVYGDLQFASARPMDSGLMYQAAASGDVDVISAYATDGRIITLDLVIIEDDKQFFPPYDAAPIVRQDTLEENEGLREVLNSLGGKIDRETMQGLNARWTRKTGRMQRSRESSSRSKTCSLGSSGQVTDWNEDCCSRRLLAGAPFLHGGGYRF